VVVGKNTISGGIPSEIGELDSLVVLNAGSNNFSGNIPTEFGNLAELQNFDVGRFFYHAVILRI